MPDLLDDYLRVERIQAHWGRHNLKSSWTQCANIFFPFRYERAMQYMLASFLTKELKLDVSSIDAVELEYEAPGKLAPRYLLGEKKGKRGSGQTSPDVAISFTCADGSCAIYLIENKYTEHNFYPCSAAQKSLSPEHERQGLGPNPDPERCGNLNAIVNDVAGNCHQVSWGRKYFPILIGHFDSRVLRRLPYCPAKKDGYQLMRQQALAQGIADLGLFDRVFSGVAYDERNARLIGCLGDLGMPDFRTDWPRLLRTATGVTFHCFSHQALVSWVTRSRTAHVQRWGTYVRERYGY